VDVLSGKDNWEESLVRSKAPHETLPGAAAGTGTAGPAEKPAPEKPPEGTNGYKRWKPEI
jgi:hypothetical protein